MGVCLSCLKSKLKSSEKETELTEQDAPTASFTFVISRKMSSPSVNFHGDGLTLSGDGLALVDVSIEQDAAYWEWHVTAEDSKMGTDENADEDFFSEETALKFGCATRKNRQFYETLEMHENDDEANFDDGTKLMRAIPNIQDGDTIGVACQQSDLPMVQFLLNGEPLHEIAISRFRGMVFPSVLVREGFRVKFVWNEDEFKELSPHVRFGPLIPERGLI